MNIFQDIFCYQGLDFQELLSLKFDVISTKATMGSSDIFKVIFSISQDTFI